MTGMTVIFKYTLIELLFDLICYKLKCTNHYPKKVKQDNGTIILYHSDTGCHYKSSTNTAGMTLMTQMTVFKSIYDMDVCFCFLGLKQR